MYPFQGKQVLEILPYLGWLPQAVLWIPFGKNEISKTWWYPVYHAFQNPKAKKVFRTIGHCSIYLLIAGTYTPFTLVNLRGGWGWTLFGIIWGLAVFGILFKIFHTGKFKFVSTMVYLAMGWLIIIAIKPLLSSMSLAGFFWLLAGGLSYSFGVIFYAFDRISFFHAVWHLFVLGGSVCHFFAILYHVLPPA